MHLGLNTRPQNGGKQFAIFSQNAFRYGFKKFGYDILGLVNICFYFYTGMKDNLYNTRNEPPVVRTYVKSCSITLAGLNGISTLFA